MKIYVTGDSISIHYGPYLEAYLRGVMDYARKGGAQQAMQNLDNPQGANGGDSDMVLSFLKTQRESGGIDADLLLLNCGLHDIKTDPATGTRQITIERYKDNLQSIVQTVQQMSCSLIWIRTTPCDEAVHNHGRMTFHRFAADCEAYNRVADQVMKASRVPIIDLYTFTRNLGEDLYCDHVHFHDPVRQKQAAFIAGWLSNYDKNI